MALMLVPVDELHGYELLAQIQDDRFGSRYLVRRPDTLQQTQFSQALLHIIRLQESVTDEDQITGLKTVFELTWANTQAKAMDMPIPRIYDKWIAKGHLCVVREVPNYNDEGVIETLRDKDGSKVSTEGILGIVRSVAHALDLMHRYYVTHPLLTPDFIEFFGQRVKVSCFGFSSLGGFRQTTQYDDQLQLGRAYVRFRYGKADTVQDHELLTGIAGDAERVILARVFDRSSERRFRDCMTFVDCLADAIETDSLAVLDPVPPPEPPPPVPAFDDERLRRKMRPFFIMLLAVGVCTLISVVLAVVALIFDSSTDRNLSQANEALKQQVVEGQSAHSTQFDATSTRLSGVEKKLDASIDLAAQKEGLANVLLIGDGDCWIEPMKLGSTYQIAITGWIDSDPKDPKKNVPVAATRIVHLLVNERAVHSVIDITAVPAKAAPPVPPAAKPLPVNYSAVAFELWPSDEMRPARIKLTNLPSGRHQLTIAPVRSGIKVTQE